MSSKKTSTETTATEKQEAQEAATAAETVAEKTTTNKTVKETAEAVKEAQYTHRQLIDGCAAFGTNKAIVATALRGTDKKLLTESEAKEIVDAFKNKKR